MNFMPHKFVVPFVWAYYCEQMCGQVGILVFIHILYSDAFLEIYIMARRHVIEGLSQYNNERVLYNMWHTHTHT